MSGNNKRLFSYCTQDLNGWYQDMYERIQQI